MCVRSRVGVLRILVLTEFLLLGMLMWIMFVVASCLWWCSHAGSTLFRNVCADVFVGENNYGFDVCQPTSFALAYPWHDSLRDHQLLC